VGVFEGEEAKMTEAAAGPTKGQIFKVALASIVGSVIEQFDFLVTGVIAATVWGGVFFKLPGVAAVAAAIGVYGIGIIIRPVGAYIFGNIADRRGRRDALVYALVLMGVSTLLIGLTPTYDSIGVIAPVLLIVFRLLQGISSAPSSAPPRHGWSNKRRIRSTAHSGVRGSGSRSRSGCCWVLAR